MKKNICLILCFLFTSTFLLSGVCRADNQETLSITQKVAAKRASEHNEINKMFNKAKKLFDESKYQECIDVCGSILDQNSEFIEAKELMDLAVSKQKAVIVAEVVARKRKSMRRIEESLNDEFIEFWRRPDERNIEVENFLKSTVENVKKLWNQGKYEQALDGCEDMLEKYPPDITARVKINEIIEDMRKFAEQESEVVKRKRILAVRKAWLSPKVDEEELLEQEDYTADTIISTDKQQLLAKANRIIPEINFTDAHLRDVIQYLSKISGVNIILDEDVQDSSIDDRVTISLKSIPLIEALRYILISKAMEYRIEDHAIWIAKDVEDVEMVTRIYKLPKGSGITHVIEYEGDTKQDEFNGNTSIQTGGDITQLLREAVPFPPQAKIFLDPRTSTLLVTNTISNHTLIEEVLKSITAPPIQVQIEAKFVEIREVDGNELGMEFFLTEDWRVSGGTPTNVLANSADAAYGQLPGNPAGTYGFTRGLRFSGASSSIFRFSGVLTDPQFSAILHAISQNEMTDIISSPKLTTINGQQAIITDVTEYIYPLEFTVTQATFNDDGDAVTPSVISVGDFQTRKIGIVLSVTPNVGADKKTINMTIIPEVSDIRGWVNFGTANAPINVPHFDSDNVVTTVVVNDGETVVMGGLIRESVTSYDDKIPFLGDIPYIGRAFRLQRENSTKTNLLIFVTAKVITPSGAEYKKVLAKQKEKDN